MSDPQEVPDRDRPVLPEEDDRVERTGVQGDLAPEDERDAEAETEPSTEDLQEPSTEKEPGEEPKAPERRHEPQPSHEAVGIGVIGRPQTDIDETSER